MKVLSLSIAMALVIASLSTQARLPTEVKSVDAQVTTQEAMQIKNQNLKKRLAKHGLYDRNRPHLFKLINNRVADVKALSVKVSSTYDADKKGLSVKSLSALNKASTSPASTNCTSTRPELCSFFKHTGIRVVTHPTTQEKYVVLSALNSRTAPTDYTLVDIMLVNEKGVQLTLPNYNEYFQDGSEQKRKEVYSFAKVSNILPELIRAERIFADGWVTTVYKNKAGVYVVEDHNIIVEYSRATLLAQLGYIEKSHPMHQPIKYPPIKYPPTIGLMGAKADEIGFANNNLIGKSRKKFEPVIDDPIDHRSKDGDDVPDGKIIICLNRNYDDCDYDNIYPLDTPVNQTKLKIPFKGKLTVRGKVKRIYRSDFTTLDISEVNGEVVITEGPQVPKPSAIDFGTNIFVQTKEGGGAHQIKGNPYQDITGYFANSLEVSYDKDNGLDETTISWDIPQEDGVFGDATLFGRYADAHWIMQFAVDNKPFPHRDERSEIFVIGSTSSGVSSWSDIDHPQMQIVYSCLAKGSLITLADGSEVAIETLKIGDTVLGASQFSPTEKIELDIADISVGVETIPMVELTTHSGKTLLLTESHPVIMQSGKSIWANKIEEGAFIQTKDGLDKVVEIDEVNFEDNVYNLRLARTDTDPNFQMGETFSMFANGLLVGDLATQSANEFEEISDLPEAVINRLPEAWHQDYLNSLEK